MPNVDVRLCVVTDETRENVYQAKVTGKNQEKDSRKIKYRPIVCQSGKKDLLGVRR